jgi:hypothetical protein
MQITYGRILFVVVVLLAGGGSPSASSASSASTASGGTEAPLSFDVPQPGVAEVVGFEGDFVRSAYTDEGFVVVGFQPANRSIGDEWMVLDVGVTVLGTAPSFALSRADFSLETPHGAVVPLATVSEQRAARLQKTVKLPRDPVAYFPRRGYVPCDLGFFPELDSSAWAFEEVELNPDRACIGRIYFRIPGGIELGQHWLDVKFNRTVVRVPFTVMSPEEERYLQENFKEIRRQVDEAFAPKG